MRLEPIEGGKGFCVHHWRARGGPGHDYWMCEKCGARTGDFFMAPPDFMTFFLPMILAIGTIGGWMAVITSVFQGFYGWYVAFPIAILSTVGAIWWVREAIR